MPYALIEVAVDLRLLVQTVTAAQVHTCVVVVVPATGAGLGPHAADHLGHQQRPASNSRVEARRRSSALLHGQVAAVGGEQVAGQHAAGDRVGLDADHAVGVDATAENAEAGNPTAVIGAIAAGRAGEIEIAVGVEIDAARGETQPKGCRSPSRCR